MHKQIITTNLTTNYINSSCQCCDLVVVGHRQSPAKQQLPPNLIVGPSKHCVAKQQLPHNLVGLEQIL